MDTDAFRRHDLELIEALPDHPRGALRGADKTRAGRGFNSLSACERARRTYQEYPGELVEDLLPRVGRDSARARLQPAAPVLLGPGLLGPAVVRAEKRGEPR